MSGGNYKYVQRWNFKMLKPIMNEPFLTEVEAGERYARRSDWFTVLPGDRKLGVTTEPREYGRVVAYFVIEVSVSDPDFTVYFCSSAGSIFRNIWYKNIDGRLFKSRVIEYTYPDHEKTYKRGDCTKMLTGNFEPDGYASLEINDKSEPTIRFEEYRDVPVDGNWMDVPEFGAWEPLTDPDYNATRR